ncbi:(R)-mandelonitrile lyase 1-like [Cucumis melo var. makuwa]|uniref:(R)-mandelonitrile lyase 1-like n=1 Tax=Cucumis melo var. makuwa TaxID=1194695 RepID=A0A5A7U4B3_CUCMM|nr:(R)-mandelonitrile lyase 1-like [Cucumis melo var. makuwa]TYK07769.1 (R)-mandelonitrile lyase 1-like [Cucumis melo var. makuwa]
MGRDCHLPSIVSRPSLSPLEFSAAYRPPSSSYVSATTTIQDMYLELENTFNNAEGSSSTGDTSREDKPILPHAFWFSCAIGVLTRNTFVINAFKWADVPQKYIKVVKGGLQPILESLQPLFQEEICEIVLVRQLGYPSLSSERVLLLVPPLLMRCTLERYYVGKRVSPNTEVKTSREPFHDVASGFNYSQRTEVAFGVIHCRRLSHISMNCIKDEAISTLSLQRVGKSFVDAVYFGRSYQRKCQHQYNLG